MAFELEGIMHLNEMPISILQRDFEFQIPVFAEQVEARMDQGMWLQD